MPLNEHEQRILEEIERQFYEEDPELARSVARASWSSRLHPRRRLVIAGFVLGLVVMLASFTTSAWIAAGGFLLMLGSVGWFAMGVHRGDGGATGKLERWLDRARQRRLRNG